MSMGRCDVTQNYFYFRSEPRASISSVKDVYPGSPDSSLYGSDEEQEDASQYCRGGYHPVSFSLF